MSIQLINDKVIINFAHFFFSGLNSTELLLFQFMEKDVQDAVQVVCKDEVKMQSK